MCTLHTVIPENDDKVKSLLKPNGKVPGNGELYKRATNGITMAQAGLSQHRALDDMAVLIYQARRHGGAYLRRAAAPHGHFLGGAGQVLR